MNILTFLESVKDDPTLRYEGSASAEFTGFSYPGKEARSDRFYVVMDGGWSRHYRKQYRENSWTIDELESFIARNDIKNIIAPTALRGARFISSKEMNCLFVDDVHEFIGRSGFAMRSRLLGSGCPVVGVTGSAGKTTLKEMLAHAYQCVRPDHSILSPDKGANIFVRALGELASAPNYDASVLELTGSALSQVAKRGQSISPDVAVITSISHAHTQRLGGTQQVAEEKSSIFDNAPADGVAVINIDTPHSSFLTQKARSEGYEIALFGTSETASYRLMNYDGLTQMVHARIPSGTLEYYLGAPGEHMAYNSLAVLATLDAVGISDLQPALDSFASFRALPGRGEISDIRLPGGGLVRIIDETYNANPASMRAAISTIAGMKRGNRFERKVVVLGDMLELGAKEHELHQSLWTALEDRELDRIHLYGPLMSELFKRADGDPRVHYWKTRGELAKQLRRELQGGEIVTFKASNGTALDKVIQSLWKHWEGGDSQ